MKSELRSVRGFCLLAVSVAAVVNSANAQLFVDKTSPTNGPGSGWSTAFHSPQEAIDEAVQNYTGTVTIRVAEGTYTPDPNFTNHYWPSHSGSSVPEEATIRLADEVHLLGGFVGYNGGGSGMGSTTDPDGSYRDTILSGIYTDPGTGATTRCYHVLVNADTNQSANIPEHVTGFVIMEGRALGSDSTRDQDIGGGLLQIAAATYLDSVTFADNWADRRGGAIYRDGGNQTDLFSRFSYFLGNHAKHGAGLFVENNAEVTDLCNVRFQNNGAFVAPAGTDRPICLTGGALRVQNESNLRMSNGVLDGNHAINQGGAFYWHPETAPSTTVSRLHFRHCTFSKNSVYPQTGTSEHGSAVYVAPGNPVNPQSNDCKSIAYFYNSILHGNTGGAVTYDLLLDGDASGVGVGVTAEYSDIGSAADNVTDNPSINGDDYLTVAVISQDPKFVNAAAGNFRLDDSLSPCIDAGNTSLIGPDFLDIDANVATTNLPLDYLLQTRVVGSPDMGAYEDQ